MNEAKPEHGDESSRRRNRSISSAVATSIASKIGTVLLQFASIPIAIRALGELDYGLYVTIANSIGVFILFQIGVGPALTHGISRALSKKDELLEKQYFSTSWFLLLALTITAGIIAAVVFNTVPLTLIFGDKYAGFEDRMMPGLWLALAIVLLEFILGHTERAREGFLQVHINNLFGTAGNILGAVSIAVGIHFFQSIEFLILGVFGSRALARLANTIHLFWQRPELLPRFKYLKKDLGREILSDGFAFTVSQSLTTIIEFIGCTMLIAHFLGPVVVGYFGIFIQISTLMMGVIIMFTTPTWPAVVDAFTRRDGAWVSKATQRLWLLVGAYGFAAIIALPTLGTIILPLIFTDKYPFAWPELLAFGLYFTASAWGHTNNALLIGVGLVKRAALFSLLETSIVLIPAAIGLHFFGLAGLFGGMALAMIAITGWLFPIMLSDRIRALNPTPLPV